MLNYQRVLIYPLVVKHEILLGNPKTKWAVLEPAMFDCQMVAHLAREPSGINQVIPNGR